jgi:hypothetical protein
MATFRDALRYTRKTGLGNQAGFLFLEWPKSLKIPLTKHF